jgi:thiol-disulfide isomerase/thioredoxin
MRLSLVAAPILSIAIMAAGLPGGAPALPPGQAAPVQVPYDTRADAHAQVDAAFASARATGRKVLLDFGGNWCPDCRMLAGVLAVPAVKTWADQHFVTVMIDIGRRDRNVDIAQKYGVSIKGVPAVGVVTADGKLLNPGRVNDLADARSWSQQAVVDLLASWQKG